MISSHAGRRTLLTSIIIQGCGIVTGILTARSLGPVARGELAAVMLWPPIISNLALSGCNLAAARLVASEPERQADWTRAAAMVGFVLSGCAVLLSFFTIPHLMPRDKRYLVSLTREFLLSVPLDVLSQMTLAIEHGTMRWTRYNLMRVAFFLIYTVLVFAAWLSQNASVRAFVWIFIASHVGGLLVRIVAQWKSSVVGRLNLSDCWLLLRSGIPFFWPTAAYLLALQLDRILLVALLPTREVGVYTVAVAATGAQFVLGDALGPTLFALIANEKNPTRQADVLAQWFRQATLAAVGFGSVLVCVVPFLVEPIFGAEFSEAVTPAIILTIATSLSVSGNILNQGLKGAGKPVAGLVSQLLSMAVLAGSAIVLCPMLGLIGMAYAVLLASCCQTLAIVLSAAVLLGISPARFWAFSAQDLRRLGKSITALRFGYS